MGMQSVAVLRRAALAVLLALAMLAGCSGLPGGFDLRALLLGAQPSATPTPGATLTPSPVQVGTAPATSEPSPEPVRELTIWLPPELDPNAATPDGKLLKARLEAFAEETGVQVRVRIKAAQGPGGMLDALSAANGAAPSAVPALVALPRSDLETAALKGLVISLDGLTAALDDPDWYPYAQQLAHIQGATFGLPFGGDALLLIYRPGRMGPPPPDWESVFRLGQPVIFPAADVEPFLTLNLYQMLGGPVEDKQRRPVVESETLTQALQLYSDGAQAGAFPYWLSQLQTDGQAWQAYREQRGQWLVTWTSRYLAELPADTTAVALPPLGEQALSLADGWVWALSDPLPERRELSVRLAEYLVETKFLAEWTRAGSMLPPRPSALAAWPDQMVKSMLNPVVINAQLKPSNDLMASLGPALETATLQVVKRESDPAQAARAAFERLSIQKAK